MCNRNCASRCNRTHTTPLYKRKCVPESLLYRITTYRFQSLYILCEVVDKSFLLFNFQSKPGDDVIFFSCIVYQVVVRLILRSKQALSLRVKNVLKSGPFSDPDLIDSIQCRIRRLQFFFQLRTAAFQTIDFALQIDIDPL